MIEKRAMMSSSGGFRASQPVEASGPGGDLVTPPGCVGRTQLRGLHPCCRREGARESV